MCVAVAVVGGIAAAGAITSAKIQSNAAKHAADTQTAAANKALTVQQQQYQQGRQDFSPYQQAGAASVGRLQQRAQQQTPQFNPGGPQPQWGSLGNPTGGQMPQPGPPMGQGAAMGGSGMPQPPQSPAMQSRGIVSGKMVALRAPDGSVQQFPESAVPQVMAAAQAKGHQLQVVS